MKLTNKQRRALHAHLKAIHKVLWPQKKFPPYKFPPRRRRG